MKLTEGRKTVGGFGLGVGQVETKFFFKMLTISEGSELLITDVAEVDQESHVEGLDSFDLCWIRPVLLKFNVSTNHLGILLKWRF